MAGQTGSVPRRWRNVVWPDHVRDPGSGGAGRFRVQLTANQALVDKNQRTDAKLKQIGNPPAYYMNEATARNSSAAAVMAGDFEDLAFLITGKRDAVRPAILDASNQTA